MTAHVHLFDADAPDQDFTALTELPEHLSDRQLLWIHLDAPTPDELAQAAERLGVTARTQVLLAGPARRPFLLQ